MEAVTRSACDEGSKLLFCHYELMFWFIFFHNRKKQKHLSTSTINNSLSGSRVAVECAQNAIQTHQHDGPHYIMKQMETGGGTTPGSKNR
jgi:hypothetical protein